MQSRYYDPTVRRFINADGYVSTGSGPIGYNMFAYCNNNPVTRYDPTGSFYLTTTLICVIVGALVVGAIGGFIGNAFADSQGYTGADKAACVVGGAVIGAVVGAAAGYTAAPAVTAATGVAGAQISITTSGILVNLFSSFNQNSIATNSLNIPDYVHDAGSLVNWAKADLQDTKTLLNLNQTKELFGLADKYGVNITATVNDLAGHPGTSWDIPHFHLGNSRIHIGILSEAIKWVEENAN